MKAPVWLGPKRAKVLAERFGTPYYAYSTRLLRARAKALVTAFPGAEVRYAMKANACPAVLSLCAAWDSASTRSLRGRCASRARSGFAERR